MFISCRKCCVIFTADEDHIPINTHESRFSKSTERIKSKNISVGKVIQSAGQLNTCFPLVRTFGPKIPVQMFAYLISKLLCNINRDVRAPKSASLERTKTSFGSVETLRETYLESLLKLLVGKIIFYVFIVIFTSEISLVISLHDWFTLGALAADKNSFITRSKVVSRKVLNGLNFQSVGELELFFLCP